MTTLQYIKKLPAEIKDHLWNKYNLYIEKHICQDKQREKMLYGVEFYYVGYMCDKTGEVYGRFNAENTNLKEALKAVYEYLKREDKIA